MTKYVFQGLDTININAANSMAKSSVLHLLLERQLAHLISIFNTSPKDCSFPTQVRQSANIFQDPTIYQVYFNAWDPNGSIGE